MRSLPILVASLLVTALAVAASPAQAAGCERVNLETNPYLPGEEYGELHVCDEDNNGQPDTVRLETEEVYSDSEVSVVQDRRTYPGGQDEDLRATALVSLGTPLSPAVSTETSAENDGDDDSFDRINHQGGAYLAGPVDRYTFYFVGLWDLDQDGSPDAWGLLLCATDTGCDAPSLSDLPDPNTNQLPDPVVFVPGVGYVP